MNPPVDRETYEAALEAAVGYMSDPPAPGTAGEASFDRFLAVIEAYARDLPDVAPEQKAFAREDSDLESRLQALKRRTEADHPRAADGIGPTLGMDLGR